MVKVLKILFAEDLISDFELAKWEIENGGVKFIFQRVDTEEEFRHALHEFSPDLVISDYSMPSFDGLKALEITRESNPYLPFIMLTGSTNEETAVECLKRGASDYVLKERIKRLPFAVKEAMVKRKYQQQQEETLLKLRESEYQLKRAQEIANIGSWEFNFNTGMVVASEEAKNIYGITDNARPITDIQKMVLPQYRPLLDAAMKDHIELGKPYNVEFQIERDGDGQIRHVHSMAEYSKEKNKLTGIIKDITESKNNESLKQEILVARESARFKQDFLAQMSHEIRTPLTAIGGIIELMDNTPLNDTQKDFMETLKFSSESLKGVINEILDYSSIEAGKIKLYPVEFPLEEILSTSEKLFRSICKKDLKFSIIKQNSLPEFILADKHRVFQVITNLLSNAAKYTPRGAVTLEVVQETPPSSGNDFLMKIIVSDTGPGIRPELEEKLFKPFSQIHDTHEVKIEGTGLGLSISKELTTLLGGEIGLKSTPGKGSSFWFTFKTRVAEAPGDEKKDIATHSRPLRRSLHILLAEDKKVNQKVISMMLAALGHNVTLASNGREALELCKKTSSTSYLWIYRCL